MRKPEFALRFSPGIDVIVGAEEVECSLDTAIPLGLIANEAISNSLKHAFPCKAGPVEFSSACTGSLKGPLTGR